jgi:integrase
MASIDRRVVDTATGRATRYDVRYRDPSGKQRKRTFRTAREAERFARKIEVEKESGGYVDPNAGRTTFADYADSWLDHRPKLRPRTREFYEGLLRNHINPTFGDQQINRITPSAVRTWWAQLHRGHLSEVSCAKAYRLLRSIMATAETDELIPRNPCRIEGAGVERSEERPVATIEQVWDLAGAVPENLRCMVLLFGFVGLRLGEALALERRHVDLDARTVRIEQQEQELRDGTIFVAKPKTRKGIRTVSVPAFMATELAAHLDQHVRRSAKSRLFTGEKGGTLRRVQWQRIWERAKNEVGGLPADFHAHDLRHTANTITAAAGASTRELMERMGHASSDAALRYQHATRDRDRAIADLVGDLVEGRNGRTERSATDASNHDESKEQEADDEN